MAFTSENQNNTIKIGAVMLETKTLMIDFDKKILYSGRINYDKARFGCASLEKVHHNFEIYFKKKFDFVKFWSYRNYFFILIIYINQSSADRCTYFKSNWNFGVTDI